VYNRQKSHLIKALIDTGASGGCIDLEILKDLEAKPSLDTLRLRIPGQEIEASIYRNIKIYLRDDFGKFLKGLEGGEFCGISFNSRPYKAILGRDFLSFTVLNYNGKTNQWSINFPDD
jgi:hypothetical protein